MGKEARVIAEVADWSGEGKLLLETDELIFRGARRLAIPLASITSVSSEEGWLTVITADGEARFDIGVAFVESWVHAIMNPRTLIDKLDVKPTSRVLVVSSDGASDDFIEFVRDVDARAHMTVIESSGAEGDCDTAEFDVAFLLADEPSALDSIGSIRRRIRSTGGIWVLHPRGRRDLSHDAIMQHGRPAGLVDVKSARFSGTHGALKLMVPRAQR